MGLDIVELFFAVEDAFQIHIENEEAEKARTVSELYNLVIAKLQVRESNRCLTSSAFYRIRRGIVDTLGIDRHEIKPSTPLQLLLPRSSRRAKWRRIQAAVGLPDLRHPGWIQLGLLVVGVVLAVGPGIYGRVGDGWIALLFLLGLVVGGFLIKFSPALAVVFPNHVETVGDLARNMLAPNHALRLNEVGSWNKKEDVWEFLCCIIVAQTGVDRGEITPEASFVDDLRID